MENMLDVLPQAEIITLSVQQQFINLSIIFPRYDQYLLIRSEKKMYVKEHVCFEYMPINIIYRKLLEERI